MTTHALEAGPAQLVLAASVARRYYVDGCSKVDIADETGLSRFKVARLLEFARTSGLVRIEIGHTGAIDLDLSQQLQSEYGLEHAIVVDTVDEDLPTLLTVLGGAAADLLAEVVTPDDVLGLAWARAVSAMTSQLTSLPRVPVVQLTGVIAQEGPDENSVGLVREAARIAGGPAYLFYAPLIVPDAATARAMRRQPEVASAMTQIGSVTKAVVGLGLWEPSRSTLYDALEPSARRQLVTAGAVAEVSGVFIDLDGRHVVGRAAERLVTVTAEQLRAIPEVIAIAYDVAKAPAFRAAVKGGLVNAVVTHTSLARVLLDDEG